MIWKLWQAYSAARIGYQNALERYESARRYNEMVERMEKEAGEVEIGSGKLAEHWGYRAEFLEGGSINVMHSVRANLKYLGSRSYHNYLQRANTATGGSL
jgi:hypothetical protein